MKLLKIFFGLIFALPIYANQSIEWCEENIETGLKNRKMIGFNTTNIVLEKFKSQCSHNGVYQKWMAESIMVYQTFEYTVKYIENELKYAQYDTYELKILLAESYFELDDISKLWKIAQDLYFNYPLAFGGYYLFGLYYDYSKEWFYAKFYYEKALEYAPGSLKVHTCLPHIYLVLREFDKATRAFDAACKINPIISIKDLDASSSAAAAYILKGDLASAGNILNYIELYGDSYTENTFYQAAKEAYDHKVDRKALKLAQEDDD